MAKALIAYASRTGQTKDIANLIAEGIRFGGHEAVVKSTSDLKSADDLQGFDAYVFGSATYHGEMMQPMKQLLFLAEKAGLEGKVGGAFGAFGWSGEAPQRIYDTMKHILKMTLTGDCLRLKSANLDGGRDMAQDYGKQVAAKLEG